MTVDELLAKEKSCKKLNLFRILTIPVLVCAIVLVLFIILANGRDGRGAAILVLSLIGPLVTIVTFVIIDAIYKKKANDLYNSLEQSILQVAGVSEWRYLKARDYKVSVKSSQAVEKYDDIKFFKLLYSVMIIYSKFLMKGITMEPTHKVAVITGGAQGIGKAIADAFRSQGVVVYVIDKQPGDWFVGDVSDKSTLEKFVSFVVSKSGHVDYLVNNALPVMRGIDECSYEEFQYALAVGVTAPFYLTKLLMPYFASGASVVNISSSRDRMSQPQTESYTAAKGGISALTHAMAVSLAGKARVNSISPGWIDTTGNDITGPDATQQLVGRVGKPEDIASMVMYLCSDKAGFITGENICIDGGMTRQMIYHGEHGWTFEG